MNICGKIIGKYTDNIREIKNDMKGEYTMNDSFDTANNCRGEYTMNDSFDTVNSSSENTAPRGDAPEYGMILGSENPMPHCPVMLVLDTSHSMWGAGLADMMVSLGVFFDTIRNEQCANAQIDIAAVSMGDNLVMLEEFTPFENSHLPQLNIRPRGDTPMGAALSLALGKIDERLEFCRNAGWNCVTPQLIILSDGESSDDFGGVAAEIRQSVASGRLFCRAIATGENPDLAALRSIAGDNVAMANRGGMPGAFANVGKIVSQVYEGEAEELMGESAPDARPITGAVYIDGTNVMHWDSKRSGITLDNLLAITEELERDGVRYQVLFDASTKYKLYDAGRAAFEELLDLHPQEFHQVPARTRADEFLLALADGDPASRIMSNDTFRQYAGRYPWVNDRARFIRGMVVGDRVFLTDGEGHCLKISGGAGNSRPSVLI